MSEELRQRRRTVLIYKAPSSEAAYSLAEPGIESVSSASSPSIQASKEKLSRFKNLIYSPREAELLGDLAQFLIVHEPKVLKEYFNLTEKGDHDDLAECLVALSFGSNSVFPLIRYFLEDEFSSNIQGQIMRENCVVSKVTKAYIKKFGLGYLNETLGKSVREVVVSERKHNYEVDPSKIDPDELDKNRVLLENKLTQVIRTITAKDILDKFPAGVRLITKYVAEFAKKYVPDQLNTLIGSFCFLRYFNPAIFSPEAMGLLPAGKVPSAQSRRNLILMTKVLQNLSNGKVFSNKESFMVVLNPFVEKNMPVVEQYFQAIVNWAVQEGTVHGSDEVAEVSVNDLHVFHSLVFQHKEKVLPHFTKDDVRSEFLKLLEKIGSYEKKVSFSFLDDAEQKQVKTIMTARNDEAQYIGYVDVKGKKGPEKQIVIVGMYRIIWAKPSGKVLQEAHLFDLRIITSMQPKDLTLTFKDFEVAQTGEEIDLIIDSLRRAWTLSFHGMPKEKRPTVTVQPPSRIADVNPPDEVCGGIVGTYKSLCDYHQIKAIPQVCWDLENLYVNNKHLDFKKFSGQYLEPITEKETLPLLHALGYNHYFTKLTIKHFKFEPRSFQGIIEMMGTNDTIEELTLSDVQLTDKAEKCWTTLFETFHLNARCNLHVIDFSNSVIDDKAIAPLGVWLKKYTKPITSIDLSNTCGDKAGKSTGMLSIFEGIACNTKISEKIEVLKLNRNKLPSLESPVTRVMVSCGRLNRIELSWTSIDLNVIAQMGLLNHSQHLRTFVISHNKFPKPEQWGALLKFLESPSCNLIELNIRDTQVPGTVLSSILTKLNPNCNLKVDAAENNLGKAGGQLINTIGAQIANVVGLDLSDNGIGDEGLALAFEGLYNCSSLTYLNVNRNFSPKSSGKREQMIHTLTQLINHTGCPLETLHFTGATNSRLREAIIPFISALAANNRITEIDISGHGFGNKGAMTLARTIEVNHVLETVLFDENGTGTIGLSNIRDAIQANSNIKFMPLPWRDVVAVMNLDTTDKAQFAALLERIEEKIMKNNQAQ